MPRRIWNDIVDDIVGDEGSGTGPAGSSPLGVHITSQPQGWLDDEGADATFTVTATSGNGSTLTYQWQEYVGGIWTTLTDIDRLSGTGTGTLTVSATLTTDSYRRFRCLISNSVNTKYSVSPSFIVRDVVTIGFLIKNAGGTNTSVPRTVLNAAGDPVTVLGTVLNSAGAPVVVM